LLQFGLIPEFVGRLPVVATLDDLDEDALVTSSQAEERSGQQYQRLSRWRTSASSSTTRRAAPRSQGESRGDRPRGLRSIMEQILLEPMFELPGLDGVSGIVSKEVSEGRAQPLYIYSIAGGDVGTGA